MDLVPPSGIFGLGHSCAWVCSAPMYAPFFGLSKEPFSIAPDPRFLFMSDSHREALAHLLYGVSGGGGFVLLTGEIGAGKTTVCRAFLDQVPPNCQVAYIFNPRLTVLELLQTVGDEFSIPRPVPSTSGPASVKDYVDALNKFLLASYASGLHVVLIIDEAQSLAADVLEQLRLLTNLETSERKLLQIVLIGQPELRDMLARPDLEQLAQRVIARYHLPALSAAETAQYIQHRLAVAGPSARGPFDGRAVARIHALTGGVPRRINLLCDRAMLGAYAHGQHQVGRDTVEQAAREVFGPPRPARAVASAGQPPRAATYAAAHTPTRLLGALAGAAVVLGLAMLVVWVWRDAPRLNKPVVAEGGTVSTAKDGTAAPAVRSANTAPKPAVGATAPASAPALVFSGVAPGLGVGVGVGVGTGAGAGAGAGATPLSAPADAANVVLADASAALAIAWREEDAAWRELALAWQVVLPPGEACAQAATAGLACYRSSAGLTAVRQLGRPGLLVLRDAAGAAAYVQLLAVGSNEATLAANGRTLRLSLTALARLWRGEFATLWRTPPGWREGAEAAAVPATRAWLQGKLPALAGEDANAPLRERVRAFQVASGLQPDARVGPLTLMLLGGADEPRLK